MCSRRGGLALFRFAAVATDRRAEIGTEKLSPGHLLYPAHRSRLPLVARPSEPRLVESTDASFLPLPDRVHRPGRCWHALDGRNRHSAVDPLAADAHRAGG